MRYTWSGNCAFSMAALPKAAANRLKLAGAPALRVLIWLCCTGNGTFDATACAADCGGSPADCEDALRYWVKEGIVTLSDAPVKAEPALAVPVMAPVAQSTPVVPPLPAASFTPLSPAERPTREQAVATREHDERFAFLLETASKKLAKPLSPADMTVYLYLYRTVGLPPEVILMIIGYAVQQGKAKLSYIEKTALNWAERGIVTIDAADAHLCHMEHCEQAWKQVTAWCGETVEHPTVLQKETVCRWLHEWKLSQELVVFADTYTKEKIGKFQVAYMDRVLAQLHEDGITDADSAKALLTAPKTKPQKSRMKTASGRAPSFNINEYEQMALRHRPQVPPKEEE